MHKLHVTMPRCKKRLYKADISKGSDQARAYFAGLIRVFADISEIDKEHWRRNEDKIIN